jgi:hypothetical protein
VRADHRTARLLITEPRARQSPDRPLITELPARRAPT